MNLNKRVHRLPAMPATASQHRSRGFTLIEVMIVVAVIGILAAIAYPSYAEHVRRGHRAEARAVLLEAAQFMQRFYSVNDRYDEERDGTASTLPAGLQQSPTQGGQRYEIVIADAEPQSYTLEARPTGAMAGDDCGVLILNSLGQRDVRAGSRPVDQCWR